MLKGPKTSVWACQGWHGAGKETRISQEWQLETRLQRVSQMAIMLIAGNWIGSLGGLQLQTEALSSGKCLCVNLVSKQPGWIIRAHHSCSYIGVRYHLRCPTLPPGLQLLFQRCVNAASYHCTSQTPLGVSSNRGHPDELNPSPSQYSQWMVERNPYLKAGTWPSASLFRGHWLYGIAFHWLSGNLRAQLSCIIDFCGLWGALGYLRHLHGAGKYDTEHMEDLWPLEPAAEGNLKWINYIKVSQKTLDTYLWASVKL